jgi:two-component system, sporulation sensor kinase E
MARLTKKKMIKNAQEELLAIFDSINDPICIIDENFTFKRLNVAMADLIGLDIKDALGKECYKHLLGKRKPCEPCYFSVDNNERSLCDRMKKSIKGQELIFEVTTYPYQNGNINSAIFHYKEVTDKINLEKNISELNNLFNKIDNEKEKELERTQEKFEKILEHSPLGIAILDDKRNIITANSAFVRIIDYKLDELLGKPFLDVMQKMNRKIFVPFFVELEKTGVHSIKYSSKTRSGKKLKLLVIGFLLTRGHGDSHETAIVTQDMTKKDTLTKELISREGIVATGRMTASLISEIKKPLLGIKNTLNILKDKLEEEPEKRNTLKAIVDELLNMQQFMEKVRVFYLQNQGRRKIVDLNEIVTEFIFIVESRLREKNIVVNTSLSRKLPTVFVYPEMIRQSMLHIVNNAEDAMSSGGKITISTRKRGPVVQLIISNPGDGIDKKTLEQIQDPSFMGDSNKVALGLFISRAIMKKHDGTLELKSSQGEGVKVVLNIPLSSKVDD